MVPRMTERLMESSEEELMVMADLVSVFLYFLTLPDCLEIQKGVSTARSDDTKSLKGVVLDWITPRDTALHPPLSRNIKTTRGFYHAVTGALLCPAGLDWNDTEFVIVLIHLSTH